MAHLLGCESVTLEYPSKKVLTDVTLGIDEGERVGVLGANGDGKSTLLAVLAGQLQPDSGSVVRRTGVRVTTLRQADSLDPESSVEHAVVGDVAEHTWASDARIRDIIKGLIGDVAWDARIGELSGGQRRRVDLARVLIEDSDILMLDEPTNHLDVHAIAWLAEHLKRRWPKKSGALLVVTHDRWFLDEVCLQMWEVHDGQVDEFEGGYSAYVLQRVERDLAERSAERKRRNIMRKELAWLSRGAQARSTKPKFRVAAAKELIAEEPPLRNSLELKRSAISRLGKQVVDVLGVSMRFGETRVIDNVTWHIGAGDRFGILGENGSGKTTLLNLMQGKLEPQTGEVRIGQTVKFAYLSQHLTELNSLADQRVRDVLSRYNTRYEIEGRELSPAQLLERLGFESAHLSAYVADLSGGQKRRLQLMLILLDRPNVLILDEPDNDLDTDMLAVMEGLLDTWPGTLLLITHDRHLMERVTDDQFAIINGHIRHVPGGVEEYLKLVEAGRNGGSPKPANAAVIQPAEGDGTPASAGSAPLTRADEYRLKKESASVERKMATAAGKVDVARQALEDVDASDYVAILEAQQALQQAEDNVAALEDEWLRLSEILG
ncbi:MAG TPA: ABC-F family ATP-binding cassette domain-containing protein [Coriobacteriia bacterium]|nr:ABC-F family ATP-binding cassette domain-containing protein [Coriobacteriia bacterium]